MTININTTILILSVVVLCVQYYQTILLKETIMGMIRSKKYPGVYINILKNGKTAYYCGYSDMTGTWKKVKVGMKEHGITEVYANNKRIEYINMTRLGEDPLAHKKSKKLLRFNVLAESYFQYLVDEGRKDIYIPQNRYNKHIKDHLGSKNIHLIVKADIVAIKNRMLTTHSRATTKHIISLISTIINHAITSVYIHYEGKNVCDGLLDDLKLDNARTRFLSQQDIEILLEAIKDDAEVDLFTRLSLSTGGRLKTIMNLKKKDFRKGNSVTLYNFKSEKTYESFLSTALFPTTDFLDGLEPNDYVIGRSSTLFNSQTMQRRVKKVLDKLFNQGLDTKDSKGRIVVHSFRTTFASLLVQSGTPLYDVMKLMSHSSIDMTMRYAYLAPDSGKQQINNMFLPADSVDTP